MTPFEIFFGLVSVVLGLALADLATSFARLLRAGRRVRWAPEPIIQSFLILLIIVFVWSDQWWAHETASFTVGQALLLVCKMLAIFVASNSVLGAKFDAERIDLRDHYYDSRPVTYGAMIVGLAISETYSILYSPTKHSFTFGHLTHAFMLPLIYVALIFLPWRIVHVTALVGVTIMFGNQIFNVVIQ